MKKIKHPFIFAALCLFCFFAFFGCYWGVRSPRIGNQVDEPTISLAQATLDNWLNLATGRRNFGSFDAQMRHEYLGNRRPSRIRIKSDGTNWYLRKNGSTGNRTYKYINGVTYRYRTDSTSDFFAVGVMQQGKSYIFDSYFRRIFLQSWLVVRDGNNNSRINYHVSQLRAARHSCGNIRLSGPAHAGTAELIFDSNNRLLYKSFLYSHTKRSASSVWGVDVTISVPKSLR